MTNPTFEDVVESQDRIGPYVHKTPVHRSRLLDAETGASVFLKCENLQRSGSFKIRGATNFLSRLDDQTRARGVVTHSSGNHGQALALAAQLFKTTATIVMPRTAPAVKQTATAGYGARITLCEPTMAAREATAQAILDETGGTLVHPYDHPFTIMGQGTATLEFLHQTPRLDVLLVPVSGGGLISGASLAASGQSPKTRIVGVEPDLAADAKASLKLGELIPQPAGKTIADGLMANLSALTFDIVRKHVYEILSVSEQELREATLYLAERLKIVAEPSGAAPLAALLKHQDLFQGLSVGLLVSGGNWDIRTAANAWAR